MKDPLKYLFDTYGFDNKKINRIISGKKYLAVMIENGHIGVCATLGYDVVVKFNANNEIDLDDISHRILYNAYLNAILNYKNNYSEQKDIFNVIDFSGYKNLVMIGYFKPLSEKLNQKKIRFSIFDLYKKDKEIIPIENQKESIVNADGIILTATSIFNNTFIDIISLTKNSSCDVFVLGPSSIMSKEILEYKNVKKIFGFIFNKFDTDVLNIIRQGGGTRKFNKFGNKAYI